MESTQEKQFYSDKNVLVTQARFVVEGKTFAMRNISSVTKYRIAASNGLALFLGFTGLLLLLGNSTIVVIGILMTISAIAMIILNKDLYSVRINSNSGEANAVVSKDEKYIQEIVDAVNEAIIQRG